MEQAGADPDVAGVDSMTSWAFTFDWAFAVALLAVIISGIALVVSVKSFRRSGARISVKLGNAKQFPESGIAGEGRPVLLLTATNEGLARAQVTGISLDVEGEHSIFITKFTGGEKIPTVIDGFHEKLFSIDPGTLPFEKRVNRIVKVRACVKLGGLRTRKTEWMEIELGYGENETEAG